MDSFINVINSFMQNNILVSIFIYAFISEFVIYFGIRRNDKEDRIFHILVFASLQLILIKDVHIGVIRFSSLFAGIASIASAIIILLLLNWTISRRLIYKSTPMILINGWDTLGRIASLSDKVLMVRIRLKNDKTIHGLYGAKSNISFSENLNGIFLENTIGYNSEGNLDIDENSRGIWLDHKDIETIELISLEE